MHQLTGRVLDPASPGWEAARRDFRLSVDYSKLIPQERRVLPARVRRAERRALRARANGLPIRARSGRHSYEAYSLVEGGIIADVSEMDEISVDARAAPRGSGPACSASTSTKISMTSGSRSRPRAARASASRGSRWAAASASRRASTG